MIFAPLKKDGLADENQKQWKASLTSQWAVSFSFFITMWCQTQRACGGQKINKNKRGRTLCASEVKACFHWAVRDAQMRTHHSSDGCGAYACVCACMCVSVCAIIYLHACITACTSIWVLVSCLRVWVFEHVNECYEVPSVLCTCLRARLWWIFVFALKVS